MAGHSLKLILFSASIIALATALSSCNSTGTFTATSGNFQVVWWQPTISTVSFNVSVTTLSNTWGAIGFSNDRIMPNTDVAIAGNNGAGGMFVEDRWNPDRSGPTYDPQQNLMDTSSSRNGAVLYFSFTRNINSPDNSRDIDLENCVNVLWAFGGAVGNFNSPASGLTGHPTMANRGVFPGQLCLCSGSPATMVVSFAVILLGALVAAASIF